VGGDRRNHQAVIFANVELGAVRRNALMGLQRIAVVTTCRESGRLPGGVHTSHLHRDRGDPGQTQHQDHHQRGDRERRLDGGSATITGQTLVFSARLMMFVRAVTIESPVTTV
jgi:hypothetical protein